MGEAGRGPFANARRTPNVLIDLSEYEPKAPGTPSSRQARRRARNSPWAALGAGTVAGLTAAAFGWATIAWTPVGARLDATAAAAGFTADSDGDGLPDMLELQFGSSPLVSDTDGDGVPDLLECVLGALPFDAANAPNAMQMQRPAARVFGFLQAGYFHFFVAVRVPTGTLADVTQITSLLFAPHVANYGPFAIDFNPVLGEGSVSTTAMPSGGVVATCDVSVPQEALHLFLSDLDHYMQFSVGFSAKVGGVSVTNVAHFTTTATYDWTLLSLAGLNIGGTPFAQGGTGALRPLQPASLPPGWTPNTACVVSVDLVGLELGAILVLQTTSANCLPLVPALCSTASCDEQLGRILKVIDPCAFGTCP